VFKKSQSLELIYYLRADNYLMMVRELLNDGVFFNDGNSSMQQGYLETWIPRVPRKLSHTL